jgi:hypothetical protein
MNHQKQRLEKRREERKKEREGVCEREERTVVI